MKTCLVESCGQAGLTRGWCGTHYQRWKRHGDVLAHLAIGEKGKRLFTGDENLPNPWSGSAPSCPCCTLTAYLWDAGGSLRWFCPPCRKRFDVVEEAAA